MSRSPMSRKSTLEVRAARAFTLKNYALAARHLDELLECVGENPQTLYMLALCHARLGEHPRALASARRALETDAGHLASLKLLARLHFLRGEHAEAGRLVARALELEDEPQQRDGRALARLACWARRWLGGDMPRSGFPSLAADEDRQWHEWARAYLARRRSADGGAA